MKTVRSALMLCTVVGAVCIANADPKTDVLLEDARTWTSSKGKQISALLVSVGDDSIMLRKEDGTDFTVQIAGLSEADQKFVGYVQEFLRTQVTNARPEKAVHLVKSELGAGTGFLARESLVVHLYSNYHVVAGAKKLEVSTADGQVLELPTEIEVAADRDLVRFPVPGRAGLSIAASCRPQEAIHTFGDSGGVGVVRRLDGTIVAKGPKVLEISAKIIPGNSGGPVLNKDNEVVGVVTYMLRHSNLPEWVKEGTPFSGTRRMAVRLDGAQWVRMQVSDFMRHTCYLRGVREDLLRAAVAAQNAVVQPYGAAVDEAFSYDVLNGWARKYNQGVDKMKDLLGKQIPARHVSTRDRQLRDDYSKLGADFAGRLTQYGSVLKARARTLPECCIRSEFESYAKFCDEFGAAAAKQMETVAGNVFVTL